MQTESAFQNADAFRPAAWIEYRGVRLAARFGDVAEEFRAAREGAALVDRSDRGVLAITGNDRKAWVHNLVTNAVKTLDDRSGNYAFACDVRGRIQFDMNILVLPDRLLLDIDAATCASAAAHFERYLITEDAKIEDVSGFFARLGCCGARADAVAAALGATNFSAMAQLGTLGVTGGAELFRHDFAGTPGFELIVPRTDAPAWWQRLAAAGATPAGFAAIDALRIEAGIPWPGRDIDDKTLPAETQQIERAISFNKGCYLGQEVVERMRSHGALARRLVRLRIAGRAELAPPATLLKAGADVGRVTSAAPHPATDELLALGYLKTSARDTADITAGDPPRTVTIVAAAGRSEFPNPPRPAAG
ncbi:Aminomethyltransferase [Phycisphaerae bacterium RAS1]|nr:Aminomethyltransferase [Phycisphaerae bacterium RAS1]